VQDPESVEGPHRIIVHVDGEAHVHGALGRYEIIDESGLQVIDPGQGPIELLLRYDIEVKAVVGPSGVAHAVSPLRANTFLT
jgi:16S rRNA C1402 (ribose-2'-O) methylase RsmI